MSRLLNLNLSSDEIMNGQQFSTEQLSALINASANAVSATQLVDTLSDFETEVTVLFTNNNTGADVELISNFYASYLIALLLVDDLLVSWFIPCWIY